MSRKAIIPEKIKQLLQQNHLLSVSQMLDVFEKNGDSFNKTSVYRALEKMQIDKLVCKQLLNESEATYELRQDHHDHAVCTKCDKVVPVECSNSSNQKVPGFKVDHHHTTLYGLCDSCEG